MSRVREDLSAVLDAAFATAALSRAHAAADNAQQTPPDAAPGGPDATNGVRADTECHPAANSAVRALEVHPLANAGCHRGPCCLCGLRNVKEDSEKGQAQ